MKSKQTDELIGYVVRTPTLGGWSKYHIWRVMEGNTSCYLVPLCSKGGRPSPQIQYMNHSYAKALVKLDTLWPENTAIPMNNYEHTCDKCQMVWYGLRNLAGVVE